MNFDVARITLKLILKDIACENINFLWFPEPVNVKNFLRLACGRYFNGDKIGIIMMARRNEVWKVNS